MLPNDRKLAQLTHILLGVSKSKTMRRLQDKGRGQPCPSSRLCSTVHPFSVLSTETHTHTKKHTNALTRNTAYVTLSPPTECRPSYSSSRLRSGASTANRTDVLMRTSLYIWRAYIALFIPYCILTIENSNY